MFNEQEGWNWESSSQPVLTKILCEGDKGVWCDSDDDDGQSIQEAEVDSSNTQDVQNQDEGEKEEGEGAALPPRVRRPPSYLSQYDCGFTDTDWCVMVANL